jgi:hypothetical protein
MGVWRKTSLKNAATELMHDMSGIAFASKRGTADPHSGGPEACVLRMRRRAQDFLSTYHDPTRHPRHRDVLTFSKPLDLVLEGPRPFKVRVDGEDVAMTDPRRVTVHAKRIEITEDRDAMSIVSIKGPGVFRWFSSAGSAPLVQLRWFNSARSAPLVQLRSFNSAG